MTDMASPPGRISSGTSAGILTILFKLPGWMMAALLFALVLAMAPVAGSLARPVFAAGCIAVGCYAWRQSPHSHLQTVFFLFCFAPFARRVVDYYAGFDSIGIMLIGPLATILIPTPRLIRLIDGRTNPFEKGLAPITVVLICVAYAAFISLFKGAWMDASAGALKWFAPLIYAMVLIETGDRDRLIDAAAQIFQIILPIMGLYGVFQYVDPPSWDRYWMEFATTVTAGLPLPYEVRVYSTLNGPASFATITAAGILIVSFLRPPLLAIPAVIPAALALLLSQYRTAWLSLALGILFCTLFAKTRTRSGFILAALALGGMIALTIPEFNDALLARFQSFSEGTQDGSAQERLQEFVILWSEPWSSLFGVGFTVGDPGVAGTMPVDGMIIACWLMMGMMVGFFCLSGFAWASTRMALNAFRSQRASAVVLGGLGCGSLLQMPLANISAAELGLLFWTFAAIACLPEQKSAERHT
jgi:hypothetical protein